VQRFQYSVINSIAVILFGTSLFSAIAHAEASSEAPHIEIVNSAVQWVEIAADEPSPSTESVDRGPDSPAIASDPSFVNATTRT